MNYIIKISQEIQEKIVETINNNLIKRGFPIVTIKQNNNEKYPFFILRSKSFNTFPIIMKSIFINNFGGSIKKIKRKIIKENKIIELDAIDIWIPVYAHCEHFNMGSNDTYLFNYSCQLLKDKENNYNFISNEIIIN